MDPYRQAVDLLASMILSYRVCGTQQPCHRQKARVIGHLRPPGSGRIPADVDPQNFAAMSSMPSTGGEH
jgi:hypothetical protein